MNDKQDRKARAAAIALGLIALAAMLWAVAQPGIFPSGYGS